MTNCETFEDAYLGLPGNLQLLPTFDAGWTVTMHSGEQNHNLASDGVAVTRRAKIRRSYAAKVSLMEPDEADLLFAFYSGAMGQGPFRLIDPMFPNLLTADTSSGCARLGSVMPWASCAVTTGVTVDTIQVDSTGKARAVPTAGVVEWLYAEAGDGIVDGIGELNAAGTAYVAAADPIRSVPYVAAEPFTGSIYLATSAGTAQAHLSILGRGTDNSGAGSHVDSAPVTLTTNWQRVEVTAAAGALGTDLYALLALTCDATPDTAGASILLCAPQLELADAASPFALGFGVPRVLFTAGPGVASPRVGYVDGSYTLDEA